MVSLLMYTNTYGSDMYYNNMFFYPYNVFLNRCNIFLAVFIIKNNRSNCKSLQPNKKGEKDKKSASKVSPTSPTSVGDVCLW